MSETNLEQPERRSSSNIGGELLEQAAIMADREAAKEYVDAAAKLEEAILRYRVLRDRESFNTLMRSWDTAAGLLRMEPVIEPPNHDVTLAEPSANEA